MSTINFNICNIYVIIEFKFSCHAKSYNRNYLNPSDKTINVNNWSNIRFYKKYVHFNIRTFLVS